MPSSDAVYTLRLVINRENDHYTGRWIETEGQDEKKSPPRGPTEHFVIVSVVEKQKKIWYDG